MEKFVRFGIIVAAALTLGAALFGCGADYGDDPQPQTQTVTVTDHRTTTVTVTQKMTETKVVTVTEKTTETQTVTVTNTVTVTPTQTATATATNTNTATQTATVDDTSAWVAKSGGVVNGRNVLLFNSKYCKGKDGKATVVGSCVSEGIVSWTSGRSVQNVNGWYVFTFEGDPASTEECTFTTTDCHNTENICDGGSQWGNQGCGQSAPVLNPKAGGPYMIYGSHANGDAYNVDAKRGPNGPVPWMSGP